MSAYAVVAVDDPHARPDQAHSYSIPDQLAPLLACGRMVVVPFGRRWRRGWLLHTADVPAVEETKPLGTVLPEVPPLHERQIALARWVSRRGHVPIAHALALALPSGLLDTYLPRLQLADQAALPSECAGTAPRLFKRLARGPLRLDRAWERVPTTAGDAGCAVIPALERGGVLVRLQPKTERRSAKTATDIGISSAPPDRATRQLCSAVFADLTNRRGSIFLATGATWPLEGLAQLIHHVGVSGGQVLVLVPRPAQQRALLASVLTRFPGAVCLASSADWRRLIDTVPLLTIGGQWAPLASLPRLALIIVLDEHDSGYTGMRRPFIHGRELALQAARIAGATTVLISPTPDPATLWRAQRASIRRFSLASPPPARVELVDVRHELRVGRVGPGSPLLTTPLRRALTETLAAGGQALLMLNRRGSAVVLLCRRCGVALRCQHCSAALTFHGDEGLLRCHFCNTSQPRPAVCPRCGTPSLDELGAGVQRLAQELRAAFPRARLGRWDRDAARPAIGDAAVRRAFVAHELDLLVGTQLLAMREDLPPVALAAAALADVGLHLPDHRAAERTYELLSALRRRVAESGQLLIQTYHPTHWVMQAVAGDDPALFYGEELRQRRALGFPPFQALVRLTCRASSRERCEAEAQKLSVVLREQLTALGVEDGTEGAPVLLGPAPAFVEQVRGTYRWQLYLRGPRAHALLDLVPPHWQVEVDPEGL